MRYAKKHPRILRFVSMLFLIFEKGICKKIGPGILRFVSRLFLIFQKEISKKAVPGLSRFASMPFFNIWKRDILENIWKGEKQKTVQDLLGFISMPFLIFENGIYKKNSASYFEIR